MRDRAFASGVWRRFACRDSDYAYAGNNGNARRTGTRNPGNPRNTRNSDDSDSSDNPDNPDNPGNPGKPDNPGALANTRRGRRFHDAGPWCHRKLCSPSAASILRCHRCGI